MPEYLLVGKPALAKCCVKVIVDMLVAGQNVMQVVGGSKGVRFDMAKAIFLPALAKWKFSSVEGVSLRELVNSE